MDGDRRQKLEFGEPSRDNRLREALTCTEAIAMLRRHWDRPVPAIIITVDTAPVRMREALESSVPVIHKPVLPDRLYRELLALISSKKPIE